MLISRRCLRIVSAARVGGQRLSGACVEGDDDAGGVVGGQLDAGAEEAVEVRAPRREPGT
jgi:hypothetical protein